MLVTTQLRLVLLQSQLSTLRVPNSHRFQPELSSCFPTRFTIRVQKLVGVGRDQLGDAGLGCQSPKVVWVQICSFLVVPREECLGNKQILTEFLC